MWQSFLCEENESAFMNKATAQFCCTISTDVTYMKDLQPLLFHQIKFTHSQLSEVFLHGEEATVGEALRMFRPGRKQQKAAILFSSLSNVANRTFCKCNPQIISLKR